MPFCGTVWENSTISLRPLPDHVIVLTIWATFVRFRDFVAAIAGSCFFRWVKHGKIL